MGVLLPSVAVAQDAAIVAAASTTGFPARQGAVDWGLALSGGGVRSATFCVGALKALHEMGLLDSVDVISSVSGGGYASYWLYKNDLLEGNGQPFGTSAFGSDRFLRNVCYLQTLGNFVTNRKAVRLAVKSVFRTGAGFDGYKSSIERSFGHTRTGCGTFTHDTLPLSYLQPRIRRAEVPYFVINTTLQDDQRQSLTNPLYNAVELTPFFVGSPALSYYHWTGREAPADRVLWSEAVTMSAAALGLLRHSIRNFTVTQPSATISLFDGGRSENLGALALITRRIPNIIVVDAEFDNYRFDAYTNLRNHLGGLGYTLEVREIEEFLKRRQQARKPKKMAFVPAAGGSYGEVRDRKTGAVTTRIYYVKMAFSTPVEQLLLDESAVAKGEVLCESRDDIMRERGADGCFSCDALRGRTFDPDLFVYRVKQYRDYISSRLWLRLTNYRFPQTTTKDQSYYTDQLEAFIGLGYLQTHRLRR